MHTINCNLLHFIIAKSHSCVKMRDRDHGEPMFRALPLISSSLCVHFVVYVRSVCAGH